MIIGSISISSKIHEVLDDNNYCYRSMMMDLKRMNHGYSSKGSHVDEEPNVDASRFFEFL
jgi:hypothetical protein